MVVKGSIMSIRFKITFTNLIGAIALYYSIIKDVDTGIYAGVILILGKQVEPILRSWKGN